MRIRVAAPALVGALAVTGLAAPAASAATNPAPVIGKTSASSLVFGPNTTKTFTFSTTVSDNSGIKGVKLLPWPRALESYGLVPTAADVRDPGNPSATCKAASATTSVCTFSVTVNSHSDLGDNSQAGAWYTAVLVTAKDGGTAFKAKAAVFTFKRQATVTVNAEPEPVRKGGTLTVTGQLNRADWKTGRWASFGKQPVTLQFRRSGATSFVNVKTVTSSTTGALRTTATATASGTWRYVYAGAVTTQSAIATGDAVVVK
ncbi:DUF5707 domain-containing protein [Actinacidiphila acididurans]|uniref:Calcium-binding protein n=1 Tax=Actinacidiphila acididurans TaxID=2784346 RepID=A0ABS2TM67_9ACTN|nr:DUF5707 domain-containing protein [Actinacidiphila acididurans]MBM9504418.1 calcium-binding protein [Actinacidiphila acididurans]